MRSLYTLVLLWLAGVGLRITVLAIPPVILNIQQDLHLSQTAIGVLASLPPLVFACVAIPGAALIARFGILPTLISGLLLTATAGALRGISPDALTLFATTLAMAAGIAVLQPAMPPIVRVWQPRHIGFATAVYSNGMVLGESLAVSLTATLVLPMVGGNWRLSVALWSAPVFVTALLIAMYGHRQTEVSESALTVSERRWWPDWSNPLVWKLAFIMAGVSGLYFGTNAFLPGYLIAVGRPDLISGALVNGN